jgi:hypothetical protein
MAFPFLSAGEKREPNREFIRKLKELKFEKWK